MSEEDFERRLARVDFSGDSRVRAALRARLLARKEKTRVLAPLALAFAAAAASVFLVPSRAPKATAFPVGPNGLPVLPGTLSAKPAAAPEPVFETRPVALDEIFVRPRF